MHRRRRSATRVRGSAASGLPVPLGGRSEPRAATSATPAPDAARIVDILSHELRSPITTIHLGTKVLRTGGRGLPGDVRAEVVAAVEEEAERLYRLVEDLLAVARHEGDVVPLPVRPLLLQHWLPQAIDAEVHAEPRLRVRFVLPPDLPPVLADDAALSHVIRNLLRNAARYAADGMPVEVVASQPLDTLLAVDVLDRGPGVVADEAASLFEPFYRAEAARAFGSGAGLGLAAAARLMRAMDGSIEARPRDGGGARFTLRLPVAEAEEDEAEKGEAEPELGRDGPDRAGPTQPR